MKPRQVVIHIAFVVLTATMFAAACAPTAPDVVELAFESIDSGPGADERTIQSIQKVGAFFTVAYHGEFEERLQWMDNYHRTESTKIDESRSCSLFVTNTALEVPIFGRNFDRSNESPVLTKFSPPGKYSSFTFSPFSEVQMKDVVGNSSLTQEQTNAFLWSLPFYPTDGINEEGLTIGLAGAPVRKVKSSEDLKPMFVLLFIRHVLDNFKSVDQVAEFAETVSLYDRSISTISHHFMVVDATGKWLVIDYPNGSVRLTRGSNEPQYRTNHFLDGGPALREAPTSFTRFNKLHSRLTMPEELQSTYEAMDLLKQVRNGTAWSVVYEPHTKSGFLAAKENYRKLYRFGFREQISDNSAPSSF